MHTSRITNGSLFVTVLSACLSLLMTGVPAAAQSRSQQQQPDSATAANRSQALSSFEAAYGWRSPELALKVVAASNSHFRVDTCQAEGTPRQLLYENSRALIDRNQILVVTRLARAALRLSPSADA